ncbi:MAG TPA: GNAT family N-acetyltransferase [Acidimicrobiales bacterium]|nr:GNAT family N-acetyltransferase [Acidimicrobiales bacterium]
MGTQPLPQGLEIHAVTPDRWDDLAALAGERGFTSGCWCMWWRVTSKEFDERHGAGLRQDLHDLVAAGQEPGLLAYGDGEPAGWVAVAPREEYPRLDRSLKLRRLDDQPVWSITCFTIDRRHRGRGVAAALLDAAVDFARQRGAEVVEAYPIDTAGGKRSSADLFTGTLAMFERAGFEEVARRSGRPIVRRSLAVSRR